MSFAYFVSDIHLQSTDERNGKILLRFLHSLIDKPRPTYLFLVGDIFDLWIADHAYFQNKFGEIVQAIQHVQQSGVEVHFFEGNHDLHLTEFWQHELGVQVHVGPQHFELFGFQVRVEHGDQTDPQDRGYIFLRWLLRTHIMRLVCFHLPGWLVSYLGSRLSQVSRKHTSQTKVLSPTRIKEKVRAHAYREYQVRPFDLIVTGHTHVQDDSSCDVENTKKMRSVNLGSWLSHPTVFVLSASGGYFMPLSEPLGSTLAQPKDIDSANDSSK